jgi:Flp pilus assembly pilin Flp
VVIPARQLLRRLAADKNGEDLTEYALLLALLALGAIMSMRTLENLIKLFNCERCLEHRCCDRPVVA